MAQFETGASIAQDATARIRDTLLLGWTQRHCGRSVQEGFDASSDDCADKGRPTEVARYTAGMRFAGSSYAFRALLLADHSGTR